MPIKTLISNSPMLLEVSQPRPRVLVTMDHNLDHSWLLQRTDDTRQFFSVGIHHTLPFAAIIYERK
jgi:hypothetical protein